MCVLLPQVLIYRLATRATVEERILSIAKSKLLLEHVVVQSGRQGNAAAITQAGRAQRRDVTIESTCADRDESDAI